MHIYLYIYIYVHISIYVYIYMCIDIYIYTYIYRNIYLLYLYIYKYVYMYIYINKYTHICVCTCVFVCACACMSTILHTHINRRSKASIFSKNCTQQSRILPYTVFAQSTSQVHSFVNVVLLHNLNRYHTMFWRFLYPRYLDMYISNMYIWYVHIRKGTYMIFTYLLICTYLCTRLYGHICISLNVPVFVYT